MKREDAWSRSQFRGETPAILPSGTAPVTACVFAPQELGTSHVKASQSDEPEG